MQEKFKTSIGGQALIEGVMMRGPETTAMAVRKPDNDIHVEQWDTGTQKWYSKIPFVRGIFNMITSLVLGYKTLMRSAEIAGFEDEDDEPSKFEIWLSEKLGANIMTVVAVVAVILGAGLAMLLFVVLPTSIAGFVNRLYPSAMLRSFLEGVIKIGIFIGYLALVSQMEDIRRVFQYHGAEHKTIAAYEAGLELTVENTRPMTRFHPRCGTSFLLIVLVISIIVFWQVTVSNTLVRILLKLVLLPVVVGISYEIIRIAGKYDNPLTRIISVPGMWLQRLTTKEPDDSMLEVAIASMLPVIPQKQGLDEWS